jgi:tRNA pseudouridine38-40 synthase
MEKNIFLEIEYIGTAYFGFQIQNKKDKREITIQQVLEKALEQLFRRKIRIVYSSRTDKGVHAKAQAVNFVVDTTIPLANIKKALNSFLPEDIRVNKIRKVGVSFHSRFSAKSKVYRYIILSRRKPTVFEHSFSWHIDVSLNIERMNKAAQQLVGKHDFSFVGKKTKGYKSCIREIKSIIVKRRGKYIYIDIEADGFLRGMARGIVYFLVRVGKGELNLREVSAILRGKTSYVNKLAPACGLYLLKVKY